MNWRSVSVPRRLRALQRDQRGYPVPFVVLRDMHNQPHFTANDGERQRRCLIEKRCPVCGSGLDKVFWFVGGPGSAFHPCGYYMDSAMHRECMTYALKVCPYLAAPRYLNRLDDRTIGYEDLAPEHRLLVDPTQDAARPCVFVAVGATKQETGRHLPLQPQYVRPSRPYEAVEFWQSGEKLTWEQGALIISESCDPETVAGFRRLTAPGAIAVVICSGHEYRITVNGATSELLRRAVRTLRSASSSLIGVQAEHSDACESRVIMSQPALGFRVRFMLQQPSQILRTLY